MSDDSDRFAALQEAVAGTWSLEREIGRGGMATVYLARDVALDRPVAIKLLHTALAGGPDQRQRFLREARTGARLSHPHIVPIYDVVEREDLVCFVMGYVDGESLGARIRREGPIPAAETERILREVAWALAAAHAADVLHRDVTVENVLLDRRTGRATLVDFGIAAGVDDGEHRDLVGTPAYIAPELVHGAAPSVQSDLYALGITGWTMLTGRLPFTDEDPGQVLLRQVRDAIPPLSRAAAATPGRLARAVESLLAKDPAARPESVEAWLAGLEGRTVAPTLAAPLERWLALREQARPFHALAVTIVGMIGAATVTLIIYDASTPFGTIARIIAGVMATTLTIQVGMSIRAIRRAARAGFRIEDLGLALERRIAERRARGPLPPTTAGKVIRIASNLAGVALLISLGLALAGPLPVAVPWDLRLWVWRNLPQMLPITWIAFWTLRGVGVLVPGRRLPAVDRRWRLRLAFWRSPLARRLFRASGLGLTSGSAESTLHRPTELMLGLEIGELWRALPESTRFGMGDLPTTAEALRRRIDEMRTAIAQLEHAELAGSPELDELHQRLVTRRDAALTALERLRLLLLQLSGELAVPGELTRHLRDARELETELLEELGADRRVRRLIRSGPVASPA